MDSIRAFMLKNYGYCFETRNKPRERMESEITSLLEFLYLLSENKGLSSLMENKKQKVFKKEGPEQEVIITPNEGFSIVNTKGNEISRERYQEKESKEEEDKAEDDHNNRYKESSYYLKCKPKTILDNQILVGNNKMIKDISPNSEELYYYKFFKPSAPLFLCDITSKLYSKVNLSAMAIHKELGVKMSEDCLRYSMEEDKAIALQKKEKEQFVLEVLYDNHFIKESQKTSQYLNNFFLPSAYDGIFIAELINALEGKKDRPIRGIFRETYMKKHIALNYKKIFNHLLQTDSFKSDFLFQNEEIFSKNKEKLFEFIYEIMMFYMKNRRALYIKMKQSKENVKKAYQKAFTNYDTSNHLLHEVNFSHLRTTSSQSSKPNLHKELSSLSNIPTKGYEEITKSEVDYFENKRKCFLINPRINIDNQKIHGFMNEMTHKQESNITEIKAWLKEIGVNVKVDFSNKQMEEFRDGLLLYKIISQLEVNTSILPKVNCFPLSSADAVNNFSKILRFLSLHKKAFPIEFLHQEKELHQARPELILRFLQSMKKAYQNEKHFFDTLSNKSRLGTSFSLSKSFNNYSMRQITTNGRDQSQRQATPLTSRIRKRFIMSPQLFWA